VYIAMVEAGETGGFLDVVLAQIAEFQSREKELKSKVLTAMLYPCILLVLALGVLILLLTFFIPKFQNIFNNMHTALPLITQIIIGASHIVRSYGLLVALGLAGLGFVLRTWFVSEKGRRSWEGFILKVPLIGPLIAQFAMARFCRMLGTLIGAGVQLVQSLNVARRSIGNQTLVDAVAKAVERVQQGGRLGQSLSECRILFPGSVLEMISVAEESGKLDAELVRIATGTESDLDRNLKTAVAFAEPLLLFFIASFIGFFFFGMLLPVLSMSSNIK
jgi:type II secretory pathway component PulF